MNRKTRTGFTLVELLVVIAIMVVLVTLLLPGVRMATERGNRSRCAANLKQMIVGFNLYQADEGIYPQGYWVGPNPWNTTWWGALIRKYWRNKDEITRCPTANAIHGKKGWSLVMNGRLAGRAFGAAPPGKRPMEAQRMSKTVICGDGHWVDTGLWQSAYWGGIDYQNSRPDFEHNGGSNFLFADGHVTYMLPTKALQPYLWDPTFPEPEKPLD